MSQTVIVFLQNAWSPYYAGHVWPRKSWLRALEKSRSGQRLRVMIDDFDICEETTPEVAAEPSGICPPDPKHIRAILEARKPDIIIACGKQAEIALRELWSGPLLAVPHPAHRFLTDALYKHARQLIDNGFAERLALRQEKGRFRLIPLAGEKIRTVCDSSQASII